MHKLQTSFIGRNQKALLKDNILRLVASDENYCGGIHVHFEKNELCLRMLQLRLQIIIHGVLNF